MSLRGLGSKLLYLVLTTFLAAAIAELGLRAIGRFAPPRYPPRPRQPELYRYVPAFGYSLWPSRTMTYEYPRQNPRLLTVRSNADGFRNGREFGETERLLKILVVGDSYVFGEGVEASERFPDQVEDMEPDWSVDNLGMTGFGPDLMLLALTELAPKAKPDVVLLALFYDDFRRVRPRYAGMGFPTPRLALRNGALVRTPYPRPAIWERSYLYHGMLLSFSRQARVFAPLTDDEWALNGAILDQFRALSEAHRFSIMLAYLPGPWKSEAHVRRRDWVQRYAGRHDVPFLDLTVAIHGARPEDVFIPNNTHYGPGGHRIAAGAVHRFLRDELDAAGDSRGGSRDVPGSSPGREETELPSATD